MEIFGLVIIVILLSLGLLFALLIITKQPVQKPPKESIKARNYLSTVVGVTDTGCNKRTVRQLLENCMEATRTSTGWVGADRCSDGKTTCEHAREILSETLQTVFGETGYTYQLSVPDNDALRTFNISNGECLGERERAVWKIVKTGRTATINLDLC